MVKPGPSINKTIGYVTWTVCIQWQTGTEINQVAGKYVM